MTMDVSKLYDRCVFRSAARVDSHAQLQRILGNDHVVRWSPGAVDSALFCVEAPRLKLMLLRYGPEVEIQPRPFMGFTLMQMPLRGSMQICTDSEEITVGTNQAAIISPSGNARVKWSEDCEQLMVRVPHQLLRDMSQLPGLGGGTLTSKNQTVAHILSSADTSHWRALLEMLLDSLLPPEDGGSKVLQHSAWIDQTERSLALFALLNLMRGDQPEETRKQASAGDERLLPPPDLDSRASRERLAAVERYAMKKLHAPISLEDLAGAAGVRPRTLYVDCMRHHGVSPMVWLRGLRLEAARQKLTGPTQGSVTDVAIECGFGHLGRFAAYYRERFGELPSETA